MFYSYGVHEIQHITKNKKKKGKEKKNQYIRGHSIDGLTSIDGLVTLLFNLCTKVAFNLQKFSTSHYKYL